MAQDRGPGSSVIICTCSLVCVFMCVCVCARARDTLDIEALDGGSGDSVKELDLERQAPLDLDPFQSLKNAERMADSVAQSLAPRCIR